jgi:hypothetical protein
MVGNHATRVPILAGQSAASGLEGKLVNYLKLGDKLLKCHHMQL